ncbi:glycosyltransferase family 4 protein [Halioglobus sp. Uisw_031]|uniref:glycosyltransferase family 4 protein n=1 Tax=Halioglobus sp. Uisw_031 TaxID=3230977 RepID=UPI0039ECACA8
MLKILLANNFYGSSAPSGETQVLEVERSLLLKNGHEIVEYYRHSDEIRDKGIAGTLQGAVATPWNPFAAGAIRKLVNESKPNILHVHNTFPLLSPSVFKAVGTRAARVLTLHNYRLFCPAAIPMRDNQVCTECIDRKTVWPSIRHGCYRGSRLATIPLATNVALHRGLGTWRNQVDAYIALTEFQRELMINAGLPAELVHVKPNFYPGKPTVVPWDKRNRCVVFAGRLTVEKGVESLVRAWIGWGVSAPELRIIGDGDLRQMLEALASSAPQVPIRFLGQLAGDAAQAEIASSQLLVLPSECYEGFPMVVREAFAFGTPAAVSGIGPLPSIIRSGENGVVFEPGNPESLLNTIRSLWESPGELERLARGARRSFDALYTEEENYRILMDIYRQATEVSSQRKVF